MITSFITEVSIKFNPFFKASRPTRLFLALLPPNARNTGMKINTSLLPRTATEPASLEVKFKDGTEMKLDSASLGIKGVVEEVDRHSRKLQKQAAMTDN